MVASAFLLEALVLSFFLGFSHWQSWGIPLQDALARFSYGLMPALFALAGVGLFARKRWGWWIALGAALAMLLTTPGTGVALLRYASPFEGEGAARFVVGFVLMALARTGWHLILLLALLRDDVRQRLEVTHWEPARAVTVTALACAVLSFGTFALQVSFGW